MKTHLKPLLWLLLSSSICYADSNAVSLKHFTKRASEIDSRVREYPEIDYVFESKGKAQDTQHACVDMNVKPVGQLVVWLMGYNGPLSTHLASRGFHVLQPHYARQWFNKLFREYPISETCRGDMRLEAATGEDFSDAVAIRKPDGMMERVRQFLLWLSKEHPEGKWEQFLTQDRSEVLWENVIISGSSHGATTSARFAKYKKVARVVMFCGPRDQYQNWQMLPSATPHNRYFGFSHVLDSGWTGDHYCRSWEMMGLNEFGPIVEVEKSHPPYENTRRLVTTADVGNDANRAHGSVTSLKSKSGEPAFDKVWEYLFTHPVDQVGAATKPDESCLKDQRTRDFNKK